MQPIKFNVSYNKDETGPVVLSVSVDRGTFHDDLKQVARLAATAWLTSKNGLVLIEGDRDKKHLEEVFLFAVQEGKLDRLTRSLDQACFPTFFGTPSFTVLTYDSSPHSFYFMVYLGDPSAKTSTKFAMNGGVIFHPAYKDDGTARDTARDDWSVHT